MKMIKKSHGPKLPNDKSGFKFCSERDTSPHFEYIVKSVLVDIFTDKKVTKTLIR